MLFTPLGTRSTTTDWGAAIEKRYWSQIGENVDKLKARLQQADNASSTPDKTGLGQNSRQSHSDDPRPFPASTESVIWIGMSAWEVRHQNQSLIYPRRAHKGLISYKHRISAP